ncbi:MAG: DUF3502 domain-containing protein [Faecalispora jeddahensis]
MGDGRYRRLLRGNEGVQRERGDIQSGWLHIYSSPVKSEVAALDSVLAEYRLGLENGELDPEEYLPKFQQALREAGIEKVIAEKQRQLDAWVAAQS